MEEEKKEGSALAEEEMFGSCDCAHCHEHCCDVLAVSEEEEKEE